MWYVLACAKDGAKTTKVYIIKNIDLKTRPIFSAGARACLQMSLYLLFVFTVGAAAPDERFKPGDRIWYKKTNYPELWEQGVFIKATPNGSQPIIRQMPNEFHKDGYETAAQWTTIRPLNDPPLTAEQIEAKIALAAAKNGEGLMTQDEILGFLKTRVGPNPFANPELEQIKKELVLTIKRRGLDFRYEALSDFASKAGKFGLGTEVTFPLRDNFGAPTQQAWLMGEWNLNKISAAVDYVKNDALYRQNEFGVKNVGTLTVHTNGSYIWKSSDATVRGNWRKATFAEMKSEGGDGLVLTQAKGGWDWIVTQDRRTTLKGNWISIAELTTRQVRETGFRKP